MAKSYATLKRKLDKTFSEYIRRSNPPICVSCGAAKESWRDLQCGHFVSRVRLATRWDEINCHPQCSRCNVLLRGNAVGYSRFLEGKYGPQIFKDLDELSRKPTKYSSYDLQDMIGHFETLLDKLDK